MSNKKILVSACLCGINCKYNGSNNYCDEIFKLVSNFNAIPVCPEVYGGLETPRLPSEIKIVDGVRRVFNIEGKDVTKNFYLGSREVLNLAKKIGVSKCILMSRSPSCGVGKIYNGEFNKTLIDGNGIMADMLIKEGIDVIDVEEYVNKVKVIKK